ncbi:hypothetical protein [Aestuariivirga litoralis]|uniref:hypothetical protein n=1 Tax=Aestuariivirga litoralis TaxID=2650924 RepID=UPI0018C7F8FB|nr:hypothetical protein [Aestuariivirga litoralis]
MGQTAETQRALHRKKRQAAALKANLRRRKEMPSEDTSDEAAQASHEESAD